MSATLYLTTICLPLVTLLAIFGMRYYAQIQQAKARLVSDAALAAIETRLAAIAEATRSLTSKPES